MRLTMRDLENRELGIEQEKKNTNLAENNGVRAVISTCKKFNGSSTDAVEMIVMNMGMSQEKAEEKVKMYW